MKTILLVEVTIATGSQTFLGGQPKREGDVKSLF
jgi:hypothetical protein